jgi:hypothetical protein
LDNALAHKVAIGNKDVGEFGALGPNFTAVGIALSPKIGGYVLHCGHGGSILMA